VGERPGAKDTTYRVVAYETSEIIEAMTVQVLSLPVIWKTFLTKLLARRFVKNVGILTIANCAGATLSFVQGILVARWLEPELYGMTALVMSYPDLVYTFFDTRSSQASMKYLGEFHARGERTRLLAMCKLGYAIDFAIASSTFFLVLVTATWVAQRVVHHPEAAGLIVIYGATFVAQALVGTSYAVLATLGRFSLIAWMDSLLTALRVALVLGLVLTGWQVAGVIWGNVIASAVKGLLYGCTAWSQMYHTWGAMPLQGSWQALKGRRREIFGFLLYNDLNALLGMVPQQLDIILLGYFRNQTEVGYYTLAKNLSSVVRYFVGPLQSVAYIELARLQGLGNKLALRQKVQRLAVQVGFPIELLMLVGILFVCPWVLSLFGHSYLPALRAAQTIMVGNSVWLFGFWLRPLYFALGKVNLWTTAGALSLLVFLPLLPLITWRWGYLGTAWWSFGLNGLAATLALVCLRRLPLNTKEH
jgi:O-antigen/teichoic acid export membrane protein